LSHNPFPHAPPRYVRATLYRYRFTHFAERGWWHREQVGPYLPVLALDDPRLQAFLRGQGWL